MTINDQSAAWNALGHAWASGQALELVMRIANFEKAAREILHTKSSDEIVLHKERMIASATSGTMRNVVDRFKKLHPTSRFAELRADPFDEAIENALNFRNYLGHRFILTASVYLRSDMGVELIEYECDQYRSHFEQLETHIRQFSQTDYEGFFAARSIAEADPVKRHPDYDGFQRWMKARQLRAS